jgi:hypothetical protein
MKNLYLLN